MRHLEQHDDLKFGVKLPFSPLEKIFETAVFAERLNFNSVWSPDHLLSLNPRDWSAYSVWPILSVVARENRKVLIGTAVADCQRLSVAVLAQLAMTIQEISKGRFILGIGLGEAQNLVPYGIRYHKKVGQLRETIFCLRKLWTEKKVKFHGGFCQLNDASIAPNPTQNIPIWVGANSPKTIELTWEIADGWIPLGVKFTPQEYSELVRRLSNRRKSTNNFEPSIFLHTLADKDADIALDSVRESGKLLLSMWVPEIFDKYGIKIDREFHAHRLVFTDATVKRLLDFLPQLDDEPLYERLVIGTPDDCISKIEMYARAGVKHFILSFLAPPSQLIDQIKFYQQKVVQYFRE